MLSFRRSINCAPDDKVVHLFYTNSRVNAHNALSLGDLPGEILSYVAEDVGNITDLHSTALKVAHFKVDAPVMLLYNINNNLHNGTTGVFLKKVN